jgi:hypothetical protein
MDVFGTIEAVKAVSELFSPLAGEVVEVNEALDADPALVNSDPYGEGWMIKMRVADPSELDALMSAQEYEAHRLTPNSIQTGGCPMAKLTWHGHSCFTLETDEGTRILFDPFLDDNPVSDIGPRTWSGSTTSWSRTGTSTTSRTASRWRSGPAPRSSPPSSWSASARAGGGERPRDEHRGRPPVPLRAGEADAGAAHREHRRRRVGDLHHRLLRLPDQPELRTAALPRGRHRADRGHAAAAGRQVDVALLPIGDNFTMGPEDAARAVEFIRRGR